MLPFDSPKDLPSFLKEMSKEIEQSHGISHDTSNEICIASLSWFMYSLEESEETDEFMTKFISDLKREGTKSMLNSLIRKVDSEEGMNDIIKLLQKGKDS